MKLLGLFRLFLFALATVFYVSRLVIRNFFEGNKLKTKMLYTGKWGAGLMKILNVQMKVEGDIPQIPVLFVPNHRSYIDAGMISSLFHNSFVIKLEVSKWPLMGWATRNSGHIFVQRESVESRLETRNKVKERIIGGNSVAVFVEGTTFEGPGCLTFKPGMFYIAAIENIPIVPIAIEYKIQSDAWVGDDTFMRHFIESFTKIRTEVRVRIGPVLRHQDPEVLRNMAQSWVHKNCLEMRKIYDQEMA